MKETLSTIAGRLGVSISTVSRVLNGNADKFRISQKTRKRILAEARRCNYTPSFSIRTIMDKTSSTIGLLVPSLSNPYFAEMAGVIIQELKRRGYSTIVIDTMEDEKQFCEGLIQLSARHVNGIIAVPCGIDESYAEAIKRNIPIMLIDRYYKNSSLPHVTTNNYNGGRDATSILISNGHKRIACIQGVRSSEPNNERVKGYLDTMHKNNLDEFCKVAGNAFSIQNGYDEMKMLLEDPEPPTAVFALSNNITLGIIKAVREEGLHIPQDLSLISFDDFTYMDYMEPPITRVGQPVEDMAMLATKILLDQIENGATGANPQLKLSPTVIPGGSIAAPRDRCQEFLSTPS